MLRRFQETGNLKDKMFFHRLTSPSKKDYLMCINILFRNVDHDYRFKTTRRTPLPFASFFC